MKYPAVLILLSALWISSFSTALGQQQPRPEAPTPDEYARMSLVATALDIAANLRDQSLDGYVAIYIDDQTWPTALKDGDLGPFVKLNPAKPNRRAIILTSSKTKPTICVFFDGNTAFGVAATGGMGGGEAATAEIAAGYKPVTSDLLTKRIHNPMLIPGEVSADDGTRLTTYQIKLEARP